MTSNLRRPRSDQSTLELLLDNEHLWSVIAILAIILIIGGQLASRSYDYLVGDVVDADIIAPIELRVPDPETSLQRRDQASAAVLDVYDFDPFAWRVSVDSLNSLFAWGRGELEAAAAAAVDEGAVEAEPLPEGEPRVEPPAPTPVAWRELTAVRQTELQGVAERTAGLKLPEGFVAEFWDEGYRAETELAAEAALRNQVQRSMLGTTDVLGLDGRRSITVRDIANQQERTLTDLSSINDLGTARKLMRTEIEEDLDVTPAQQDALGSLLALLLRPNLTYNSNETLARKAEAADGVAPVFYQVKRGRVIVREGDVVTLQGVRELEALRAQWVGGGSRTSIWGIALLVAAAIVSLWRYVEHHRRRQRVQRVRRLHHLALLVLVTSVLMTRFLLFVGDAIAGAVPAPPYNVASAYWFAVPYAMGALVIMLLADAHVAWVYASVQTVVIGAMTGDVGIATYAMLGSFAAIYGMSRFSQRTQLLRTGFTVGIMNIVIVIGLALMAEPAPPWTMTLFESTLAMLGGLQVALLAAAMLPPLEYVFNTLTDVKLLELSNMNLPLLKQLAVAAPGTYHHSVVIGTLAEKAAEAIGANSLFTRVAAYYHDIGKMTQPEYFVENQMEKRNPHERLAPHMSALILLRHVKDGVAMACEKRLPEPLVDIIRQHHGTRVMRYFYDRARKQQDPETGTVNESEFRYPGPKPQTKEAALIMLADGVEAMSRLIEEPTRFNLRQMIRKNSRLILEDEQLDECDITLADLARVEAAFLSVLTSMHHHRIEYPEQAAPGNEARTSA